jgi:hypothetical protein
VATSKAEKESKIFIAQHQAKSSLSGWFSSMFKWSGSQEETKQQMDPSDQEFQRQLDKIVEKSDQL